MSQKRNLIAHYRQGGSDKIYMSCVRQEGSGANKTWVVMGKWGKRGGTLSSQIKKTTMNSTEATLEQMKLFNEKLRKGYEDIDTANYRGPATRNDREIKACLEEGDGPFDQVDIIKNREQPKIKPISKIENPQISFVEMAAICITINELGDKFDEGIE